MEVSRSTLIIGAFVAVSVGFAVNRSCMYLPRSSAPPISEETQEVIRTIQNTRVLDYDIPALKAGAPQLRAELETAAVRALNTLPVSIKPSPPEITQIANSFAEYIVLCRTGDIEAYEAWARDRGREPGLPNNLLPERREAYWAQRTTWARHAPIDAETVAARGITLRGQSLFGPTEPYFAISGPTRELRAGGYLVGSEHKQTAIEIQMLVKIPSVDASQSMQARIGLVLADDGPGGSWDTVVMFLQEVPTTFLIALPPI